MKDPAPQGQLKLTQIAHPRHTNGNNRIYAGWVVSQMDLAAATAAEQATRSPVVTVSIDGIDFVSPIKLGTALEFYTEVLDIGTTSIKVNVEVWGHDYIANKLNKITDGSFMLVAIDDKGVARAIHK